MRVLFGGRDAAASLGGTELDMCVESLGVLREMSAAAAIPCKRWDLSGADAKWANGDTFRTLLFAVASADAAKKAAASKASASAAAAAPAAGAVVEAEPAPDAWQHSASPDDVDKALAEPPLVRSWISVLFVAVFAVALVAIVALAIVIVVSRSSSSSPSSFAPPVATAYPAYSAAPP